MVLIAFVAAVVVGGVVGAVLRHRSRNTAKLDRLTIDTPDPSAHGGFSNSGPFDGAG